MLCIFACFVPVFLVASDDPLLLVAQSESSLELSPPQRLLLLSPVLPAIPGGLCGGNLGRGYSIYPWVGRCGAAPHTLTLFKTNIADFPTLFKTEFRFLIPCLRH